MENLSLKFSGAISLSLLLAFVISLLPANEWLGLWRPEWLALTIIHWGMFFSHKTSYLAVAAIGLLVDTVWSLPLGQHSLTYVILLYITVRLSDRMSPNSLSQHLFLVLFVLTIYMLANLWVYGATNSKVASWGYWYPVLSSLIAWPLVSGLLKHLHVVDRSL